MARPRRPEMVSGGLGVGVDAVAAKTFIGAVSAKNQFQNIEVVEEVKVGGCWGVVRAHSAQEKKEQETYIVYEEETDTLEEQIEREVCAVRRGMMFDEDSAQNCPRGARR